VISGGRTPELSLGFGELELEDETGELGRLVAAVVVVVAVVAG